jgi:hypothetical protein
VVVFQTSQPPPPPQPVPTRISDLDPL